MPNIKNFIDILTWKKSHQFVLEIYKMTERFPSYELFCLTSQIRRAAVSIPSNIAEGFKRKTSKDSEHFYNMAEGSLEEVKYQLIPSKDLSYISIEEFEKLFNLAEEVGKLLNGWKKSQK